MSELLTPGLHPRESEFVYDPDPGEQRWLTGTCGVVSCAMVRWAATGAPYHVLDAYRVMRPRNWCDPGGASNSHQWEAVLRYWGLPVVDTHHYAGDVWSGWQSFLMKWRGKAAAVLMFANGQALRDELSGKGENAVGLRYHIVTYWGWHDGGFSQVAQRVLPPGGWFSDGDNYAAGNVLQFYPASILAAAKPCAAVAVSITQAKGSPPVSWTKDPTGAHDAKGHHVGAGIAAYIFSKPGYASTDAFFSETPYAGANVVVALTNGAILDWDATKQVAQEGNGASILAQVITNWQQEQAHAQDLIKQLDAQERANGLLTAQVNTLTGELQAAQGSIALAAQIEAKAEELATLAGKLH